jgi:sarcosine oxidase subunit alpha
MTNGRIIDHPILGSLEDREKLLFTFDEQQYEGYQGETIAAALLANGVRILRKHEESGRTRGFYCNMGHCYECRVHTNNGGSVRGCLTLIEEGMIIYSGQPLPTPFKKGVGKE